MARPPAVAARARRPAAAARSAPVLKAARCRSTASSRIADSTSFASAPSLEVVNVGDLAKLDAAVTEVTPAVLAELGLVRAGDAPVKVLGTGEIGRALKVTASKFSGAAKAKIEKAGGQALTVSD